MTLQFIDLQAQYRDMQAEIDRRMRAVLDHGRYIMGPEVAELEADLKTFCGAKHAVALANGTDALQVALMALGVKPGDAVFAPSFTFTATAEAILTLGGVPVFVDVHEDTFNMDAVDLERKVAATRAAGQANPKGIIAVDLFGQPADYAAIGNVAKRENLFVIGDGAQSFGATLNTRPVGTLCDVTTTSFFPAKPLGCYGDGGALFTDNDDIAAAARSIREHGKGGEKYEIVRVGMNSRLDTLQAAVLLAKLPHFESEIVARNRIASAYGKALGNVVRVPVMMGGAHSVWAQYTLRLERRDELAAHLKAHNVPSAVYYPLPMHMQSAYRPYGDGAGSLPVSEALSQTVLSLPMHPYLSDQDIGRVCRTVSDFFT